MTTACTSGADIRSWGTRKLLENEGRESLNNSSILRKVLVVRLEVRVGVFQQGQGRGEKCFRGSRNVEQLSVIKKRDTPVSRTRSALGHTKSLAAHVEKRKCRFARSSLVAAINFSYTKWRKQNHRYSSHCSFNPKAMGPITI